MKRVPARARAIARLSQEGLLRNAFDKVRGYLDPIRYCFVPIQYCFVPIRYCFQCGGFQKRGGGYMRGGRVSEKVNSGNTKRAHDHKRNTKD